MKIIHVVAVEETNIELILAVMNTTELVVEIRPKKNSGPYGPELLVGIRHEKNI